MSEMVGRISRFNHAKPVYGKQKNDDGRWCCRAAIFACVLCVFAACIADLPLLVIATTGIAMRSVFFVLARKVH